MTDTFWFVFVPYAGFVLAVAGGVYRYLADRFSWSSFSSQLLENRAQFWGSIPWHYGVGISLLAHLLAAILPAFFVSLHMAPWRLLAVQLAQTVLGLLTIFGLLVLVLRRLIDPLARAVTTVMDWVLLASLLAEVGAGVYITLFLRWGSLWYEYTATPWLASLAVFRPRLDVVSLLPWIVKAHLVNGFILVGLFPFTRLVHIFTIPLAYLWRPFQVAFWYRRQAGRRRKGDQST